MISSRQEIGKIFDELINQKFENSLDIGCGKCGVTKRLIQKGSKVTGIDIRDVLFQDKNFKFIKEDIRNFKFEEKYDFIVSSLILHFFQKEKSIELIKKMQTSTKVNGINLLVCISSEDDLYKSNQKNFYPTLEEIKSIYSGWKTIKQVQDFTEMSTHQENQEQHSHNLIIIAFEKLSD
jgi:tellurite methyltransferase